MVSLLPPFPLTPTPEPLLFIAAYRLPFCLAPGAAGCKLAQGLGGLAHAAVSAPPQGKGKEVFSGRSGDLFGAAIGPVTNELPVG